MSSFAGVELFSAIRHATTWGVPVACGSGDGFSSKETTLRASQPIEIDDSLGLYHSGDGAPGAVALGGDLPRTLYYQGLELLLWMVTGSGVVIPVPPSATCLYLPAKDPSGCFATLVRYMRNYVYEVPSLKATGFTLTGQTGKPLQITFHCQGDRVNRNTVSGINTLATAANITVPLDTVTLPAPGPFRPVRYSEGQFQLKDQSGPAMGSGDLVSPSSFEFSYKRTLKGISGATAIDEPTNDGQPECSLKLTFPRHTAATRLADLGTDIRKKGAISFTTYTSKLWMFMMVFPHLQYRSVPVTDSNGIIQEPVEFICHGANGAVPGLEGVTTPFLIQQLNQVTTPPWGL